MKALSLYNPWAVLIAIGAKKIETRDWFTPYRGPLAIHATKAFSREDQELCSEAPFYEALKAAGYGQRVQERMSFGDPRPWSHVLPLGAIVATARLADCVPIHQRHGAIYLGTSAQPAQLRRVVDPELSFGGYGPGRWAWLLEDVQRLEPTIPTLGARGLWDWDEGQPAPAAVGDHHCHLDICQAAVPPKMLFCLPHWRLTPKVNKDAIWATYVPGQEITKRPSQAYLEAQLAARVAVLTKIAREGCNDPGEGGCIGERCQSCKAREALASLDRSPAQARLLL
jgi:hypothetical protein